MFFQCFFNSAHHQVLRPSVDYVELSLRYIDASIHIRRRGPYLSVAVRAPEYVLKVGIQIVDSTSVLSYERDTRDVTFFCSFNILYVLSIYVNTY